MAKVGANDACPCGSGQKYKKCHMGKSLTAGRDSKLPLAVLALFLVGALVMFFTIDDWEASAAMAAGGLIAAGAIYVMRDPPESKGGGNAGAINFGG